MPASHDVHATAAPGAGHPPDSRLARLLVGYDGSGGAEAAAALGIRLAGRTRGEATVVHAGPTPDAGLPADLLLAAAEQFVAYEREWRSHLERLREAADGDRAVQCRVVRGDPAGALLAIAAEIRADLILIGSHGVGRLRGAWLGSVSSQVLTHAPCSVMVFREPVPAQQAHTIVVGIDGSPSSDHALELAQALALALEAALVLVHAYDPHIPFAVLTTEGMRNELHRHGRKLLAAARGRVVASLAVEEVLVEGSAREELLAACDRHAPSLLAVGSRGLGGFKELLLGSTSRSVANRASCPVLVARRACAP